MFQRHGIERLWMIIIGSFFCFSLFSGCGTQPATNPIALIQEKMKGTPTYSVILEDMKQTGNFVPVYEHQYRVVAPEKGGVTDWFHVTEKFYKMNEPFLGMSIYARKDGKELQTATPPGYAYVGDNRYGRWREDGRGGSFWEFYGKYALISHLMGGWYRPIHRTDYDAYQQSRSRNRPYFGRNREFGTTGTIAKKQKPNFYARHMARQQAAGTRFKQTVNQRIGRTRSGFRGRSVGFGK